LRRAQRSVSLRQRAARVQALAPLHRAAYFALMCNRYASDIRKAGLEREYYGFEEWSETGQNIVLEVVPDRIGPVIRKRVDGALEWAAMRWGLPGPPQFGALPVTNLRNVASAHWRPLLGVEHR